MSLRRAVVLSVWWAIPVLMWAQQPAEMKPVTDRLAASIYNGPSMATLGELSDTIGGRLTGSPAYVRSTEWAAAKFRIYGIENVSEVAGEKNERENSGADQGVGDDFSQDVAGEDAHPQRW